MRRSFLPGGDSVNNPDVDEARPTLRRPFYANDGTGVKRGRGVCLRNVNSTRGEIIAAEGIKERERERGGRGHWRRIYERMVIQAVRYAERDK